jgi:hypothetical protein
LRNAPDSRHAQTPGGESGSEAAGSESTERVVGEVDRVYPSRRVFRFWQAGGGFDHNVFREKTVAAIVDYIHANPVRRSLVDQPTQWEWSSARFWDGCSNVPLRMDDPL